MLEAQVARLQAQLAKERCDGGELFRYNPPWIKPWQIIDRIITNFFPDAEDAVDLTPGRGHFWGKSPRVKVIKSTFDFRETPYIDGQFDIAVFDPPHNADMGATSVMKSFGTYKFGELPDVIREGCRETKRVSMVGAIVKVTDQTHGQQFVHETGWVFDTLGKPFDTTHGMHRKVRDPKWKLPQASVYNNGSAYLIYRWGDQMHVRRQAVLNT